jgi:hypothetical protein
MDRTDLIERIESQLAPLGDVTEGRVLDGDGYFLDGHLVVTVIGSDLCIEVGTEEWDTTLTSDGVSPLLFADRPVPGWVMVDGDTLASDESVSQWIETSLARR